MAYARGQSPSGYADFVMRYKDLEEAFNALHDESVEEFLKADAARLGIPWHEYCYTNGIMGKAQNLRVGRHEIQFDPNLVIQEKEDENES